MRMPTGLRLLSFICKMIPDFLSGFGQVMNFMMHFQKGETGLRVGIREHRSPERNASAPPGSVIPSRMDDMEHQISSQIKIQKGLTLNCIRRMPWIGAGIWTLTSNRISARTRPMAMSSPTSRVPLLIHTLKFYVSGEAPNSEKKTCELDALSG